MRIAIDEDRPSAASAEDYSWLAIVVGVGLGCAAGSCSTAADCPDS